MTTVTRDTLTITIRDSEPAERKQWLIKAIAAAIRWRAYADAGAYERDGENMYVLAQLLEELAGCEGS